MWRHIFFACQQVWTPIIGRAYWNVFVSWSCLILRLSPTFIHIMEGQSILCPYPFVSFPMSVDKGKRGKYLSAVNNEDAISVCLDSSGNHLLSPIRLHMPQILFETFLITQNWPIQKFMKHIQLHIISACVPIFEITGYWQVKKKKYIKFCI